MPEKTNPLPTPESAERTALDKIAAARVWLLKEKPFFGVLSRAFTLVARSEIPAFRLLGDDRLLVNPLAVMRMSFPALCARLSHLALHAALGGFVRRGGRDPHQWNLAHDYAIDPLIRGANLPLELAPPP